MEDNKRKESDSYDVYFVLGSEIRSEVAKLIACDNGVDLCRLSLDFAHWVLEKRDEYEKEMSVDKGVKSP